MMALKMNASIKAAVRHGSFIVRAAIVSWHEYFEVASSSRQEKGTFLCAKE